MPLPRSPWPTDVLRWSVDTATAVPRRVLALLSATESVVAKADQLVDRTEKVISDAEEQLTATRPLIEFMKEFSAHEIQAAIKLVDELPRLSQHLDNDILPILTTLNQVGPDLHDLLEVANDVRQAILGIPGFDLLRRRGEAKDSNDTDPTNTDEPETENDKKPAEAPEGQS